MEVIAIAERGHGWRWEIHHAGQVIKQSVERFSTVVEAIEEGRRHAVGLSTEEHRPPIRRTHPR